MLRYKAKLDLI